VRTFVILVATVGGVGYAPVASGTFGSLVAVPLLPLLARLCETSIGAYGGAIVGLVVLAIWAAGRAEEVFGGKDHSYIVVDEVAGLVVAGLFVPGTWLATGLAFVLFRLFDVVKPFPANVFDKRVRGGLGVVGDDVIAGIYAGLGARLVLRWL
jgi:phosphatidylglycerophosphatase A